MRSGNNTAAYTAHIVISTIILLAGAVLTGVSVVAVAKDWPILDIALVNNTDFDRLLQAGYVGIAAGLFLVLLFVVGLCAARRDGCGILWKIIFVVMMFVAFAVLLGIAIVSLLIARRSNAPNIAEVFDQAWQQGVNDNSPAICEIQKELMCQGFYTGDCQCAEERCVKSCAPCMGRDESDIPGCWDTTYQSLRNFFLPVGIVSSILAGIVVLDAILVCVM